MRPLCTAALTSASEPRIVSVPSLPLSMMVRPTGRFALFTGAKVPSEAVTVNVTPAAALGSVIERPVNWVALPAASACAFVKFSYGPARLLVVLPKGSNMPAPLSEVPHWLSPLAATPLTPDTSVGCPVMPS